MWKKWRAEARQEREACFLRNGQCARDTQHGIRANDVIRLIGLGDGLPEAGEAVSLIRTAGVNQLVIAHCASVELGADAGVNRITFIPLNLHAEFAVIIETGAKFLRC
jgi:hypothetical protein